jgi:hypothetical protein
MSVKEFRGDFETINQFVQTLFPSNISHAEPVVSKSQQLQEIELLKMTIGSERFFLIIDVLNFKIEYSAGIQKWLGYSDREFSLRQYWDNVVHSGNKTALCLVMQEMFRLLCSGDYPLQFMIQRFSMNIVLKHHKGHYLAVKSTTSVFQHDRENRLLSYLNEFTIIGEHSELNSLPEEIRIFNTNGERVIELEKLLQQKLHVTFKEMKVFSSKEWQIAVEMACKPGITQAQLAKEFNLSIHTMDTYYRRILVKARKFFNKSEKEFPTVQQAIGRMKQYGVL